MSVSVSLKNLRLACDNCKICPCKAVSGLCCFKQQKTVNVNYIITKRTKSEIKLCDGCLELYDKTQSIIELCLTHDGLLRSPVRANLDDDDEKEMWSRNDSPPAREAKKRCADNLP